MRESQRDGLAPISHVSASLLLPRHLALSLGLFKSVRQEFSFALIDRQTHRFESSVRAQFVSTSLISPASDCQ